MSATRDRRWCHGCGYAYRDLAEAKKGSGCPKCRSRVLVDHAPALTATRERRERAVGPDAVKR